MAIDGKAADQTLSVSASPRPLCATTRPRQGGDGNRWKSGRSDSLRLCISEATLCDHPTPTGRRWQSMEKRQIRLSPSLHLRGHSVRPPDPDRAAMAIDGKAADQTLSVSASPRPL